MAFVFVCLGAAVGAPLRYLVDRSVQGRRDGVFPWGTLTVNVVGSLALGLLAAVAVGRDLPQGVWLALGPGFCGAFTTWSTLGYETLRLYADGAHRLALANVGASLALGLSAASVGYLIGSLV